MRKVNLGTDENTPFSFNVMKTYKITANDMCEAPRSEFTEDFECMGRIPPF